MTTRMSLAEFKALKQPKRSKYNARRCEMDGIRFDSLAEREFYALLKADKGVVHIDVHPTITLPGGIRYKPDFLVWRSGWTAIDNVGFLPPDTDALRGEIIEVKGKVLPEFRRLRKLFDASHPLAPMRVVRKDGKFWEWL